MKKSGCAMLVPSMRCVRYTFKMVRDRARVKRFLDDYGKVLAVSFFVIAIGVTIFFLYSLTLPKKLHVTFFDVGQGDSILIQTPSGHEVLIDGGATSLVVKKLSKKMGYFDKHLDVMIATHDDADHITGLVPTLARYEVGTVITSSVDGTSGIDRELDSAVMHEGAQVHVGVQGEYVDFGDGVVMHILYPLTRDEHGDTNDASVVTLITYGKHSFLLTGDLSKEREPQALTEELPSFVTVYKAGHHGSKTSSGEALLSRIHPEYVVISAGRDNKYGHPHKETLERLTKYSKEILSTSERGDIEFVSDGESVEVVTEQ